MDEEIENAGPVEGRVDGQSSGEAMAPEPTGIPARAPAYRLRRRLDVGATTASWLGPGDGSWGAVGRSSGTVLGRAATTAATQASWSDGLVGRGVACDRPGGGIRHRSLRLAVELECDLAAVDEPALFGLGHLPLRVRLISLRLGHLPLRLGLVGIELVGNRRSGERHGYRLPRRPGPCGRRHEPRICEPGGGRLRTRAHLQRRGAHQQSCHRWRHKHQGDRHRQRSRVHGDRRRL